MRTLAIAAAFLTFYCSSASAQEGAQEQAWGQSQETAFPVSEPAAEPPSPRELERRAVEIKRLERVMATEGPEFDHEKYKRYRAEKAAGAALTGLGAASVVAAALFGFVLVASGTHDDEGNGVGRPQDRAAFWSMLAGGIAGIAVGAPLLAIGRRGKERQALLRRKDEILGAPAPTAGLAPLVGPQAGGLRLEVSF